MRIRFRLTWGSNDFILAFQALEVPAPLLVQQIITVFSRLRDSHAGLAPVNRQNTRHLNPFPWIETKRVANMPNISQC
jgi:hypothetical protein